MRWLPLVLLGFAASPAVADGDIFTVGVDVHVDAHVEVAVPVVVAQPQPQPALVVVDRRPPRLEASEPLLAGHRWEAQLEVIGGSFHFGDREGGQIGAHGVLGRQFGPLRLAVEGSVATFGASMDLYTDDGWWNGWKDYSGEVERVGATARLRGSMAASDPRYPSAALGGYVEGGVGHEYISWKGGNRDERSDVMLGVGMEIVGGRDHMGGMDLGVRVQAAPSVNRSDDTHDLSVLVHLGATFGS